MHSFRIGLILAAVLALACHGSLSYADYVDCDRAAFFDDDASFQLAKVVGKPAERVYFHGNGAPTKSYVIPGDTVVVYDNPSQWLCVLYVSPKGHATAGLIPSAKLKPIEPSKAPALNAWAGQWVQGEDNQIELKPDKQPGKLTATGSALWYGFPRKEAIARGAVNTGEFEAVGAPVGNQLSLSTGEDEYACRVELQLMGPYMVARDNSNCGGHNVRFWGVFRKAR